MKWPVTVGLSVKGSYKFWHMPPPWFHSQVACVRRCQMIWQAPGWQREIWYGKYRRYGIWVAVESFTVPGLVWVLQQSLYFVSTIVSLLHCCNWVSDWGWGPFISRTITVKINFRPLDNSCGTINIYNLGTFLGTCPALSPLKCSDIFFPCLVLLPVWFSDGETMIKHFQPDAQSKKYP